MRNLLKSKKGFTLVEIVIVIAIIGILIVVLVPNVVNQYRNYRLNSTKQAVAKGIVKNLEVGISGGTIPLTVEAANTAKITPGVGESVYLADRDSLNEAVAVNTIVGIGSLYDLPTNNGELMDPLATQNGKDRYYRVWWDSANGCVNVINSESASEVVRSGSEVGPQDYGKTQGGLVNPLYFN